jgi:hypothetical protein
MKVLPPVLLIISGITLLIIAWSLTPEPDLTDQTPSTKYERCLVLYGDTEQEKECDQYKRSRISDIDLKEK